MEGVNIYKLSVQISCDILLQNPFLLKFPLSSLLASKIHSFVYVSRVGFAQER